MKFVYNLVTFLAAVVVLACVCTHWDLLTTKPTPAVKCECGKTDCDLVQLQVVLTPTPAVKCPCCKHCKCGKTDCEGGSCCTDKKCCNKCSCTEINCCKK